MKRLILILLAIFSMNISYSQKLYGIKEVTVRYDIKDLYGRAIPIELSPDDYEAWMKSGYPLSYENYLVGSGYIVRVDHTKGEGVLVRAYNNKTHYAGPNQLAWNQYLTDINQGLVTESPTKLEKKLKKMVKAIRFVNEDGSKYRSKERFTINNQNCKVLNASYPDIPDWVKNSEDPKYNDYFIACNYYGLGMGSTPNITEEFLIEEAVIALSKYTEPRVQARTRYVTNVNITRTNERKFELTSSSISTESIGAPRQYRVRANPKDMEIYWMLLKRPDASRYMVTYVRVLKVNSFK